MESLPQPGGRWSAAILAAFGLCSALITVLIQRPLIFWADHKHLLDLVEPYYHGLIFGFAICAYFVIFFHVRSVLKVLAFVASAIVAHELSMHAAFWGVMGLSTIMDGLRQEEGFSLPAIFVGGSVGAFVLISSVLFLFDRQRSAWTIGRIALWSVAGGFFGLLGSLAGPIFGEPWAATREQTSVIVVWQSAIAGSLGFLLASRTTADDSIPRQRPVLVPYFFYVTVAALLCLRIGLTVRNVRAATPPVIHLPASGSIR